MLFSGNANIGKVKSHSQCNFCIPTVFIYHSDNDDIIQVLVVNIVSVEFSV